MRRTVKIIFICICIIFFNPNIESRQIDREQNFWLNDLVDSISNEDSISKEIVCCYSEDNTRSDILGVIQIKENIADLSILAYFDTNLGLIDYCGEQIIENYPSNTIIINTSNIHIGESIESIDITQLIPQKIYYLERNDLKYLIFEMYNFSYTSVGGGAIYIVIELDKYNKVQQNWILSQ